VSEVVHGEVGSSDALASSQERLPQRVRSDRSTVGSGEERSVAFGSDLTKVLFDIAQQMWRQRESSNSRFGLRRAYLASASYIVDAALDGDCAVQEVEVSSL